MLSAAVDSVGRGGGERAALDAACRFAAGVAYTGAIAMPVVGGGGDGEGAGGVEGAGWVDDGGGNRISATVNGETTVYAVDENNPTGYSQVVEEMTAGGVIEVSYILGQAVIGQAKTAAADGLLADDALTFLLTDGHGSTRGLVTAGGVVVARYDYDAFGVGLAVAGFTNTAATNILYAGQYFDAVLGQYLLRARIYDPTIGRFTSMDSYLGQTDDPLSLHKYLYADANPINRIDPAGHFSVAEIEVAAGISASLGAISGGSMAAAGGSLKQTIRATVLGAEAGLLIGLSIRSGRAPDVITAGFLAGIANFTISAIGDSLRDSQGKAPIGGPPSKAKYLDAALTGFAIGVSQEFCAPGSIVGAAIVSAVLGGTGDLVTNALAGEQLDWKAAVRDTVTTAVVGMLLNPATVGLFAKGGATMELADEVAKYVSMYSATPLTVEIGLLVHAWLP